MKEGNQPRQAAGYLADGDLVVVNDASHMIGRENVVIEVLSTRRDQPGPARVRQAGRPARPAPGRSRPPSSAPTGRTATGPGSTAEVAEEIGVD